MRENIVSEIINKAAVAVIRLKNGNNFNKIAEAIYKGGVESIELTMTTPNAFALLKAASREFGDSMIFGMGSVLNKNDAEKAIESGAKFIVSPILKKEIIETAHSLDAAAMPGCFSPTEIYTAHEFGADIIKVFPADILGINFFKGIKAPMPFLKLMPTGGVSLTNAGQWLKAGASAIGIGSALVDLKAIESEDYAALTENAKILMQSIRSSQL